MHVIVVLVSTKSRSAGPILCAVSVIYLIIIKCYVRAERELPLIRSLIICPVAPLADTQDAQLYSLSRMCQWSARPVPLRSSSMVDQMAHSSHMQQLNV